MSGVGMLGSSSECPPAYYEITRFEVTSCFSSPDRWDSLPEAVSLQPGLLSNILTFSAGPRVRGLTFVFYVACVLISLSLLTVVHRHAVPNKVLTGGPGRRLSGLNFRAIVT